MNSEESSFSPDHVEMAVLQFNEDPTNGTLNDYLTKAQLSTSAWTFVWALLRTDKDSEVQLYGANTLHLKISKHWQEVPADFVLSLQNRFFQLLSLYSDECHRIVFKKLCVCLGCFILKTVTRQWSNALYDLVASVVNPPGENPKEKGVFQKNLLEILKTIPEEFLNLDMPFSQEAQVVNELMNVSNTVYDMINKVLAEDWPEELKEAAVKCFKSWCHSGIFKFQPENESLLIHLLDLLKSQKYSLEAADAIVQFFKLRPNSNNSRVMKYLKLVTELGSFFDQQSHIIDLAQNLTKVFVSAAENNLKLLLFSINLDNEHSAISLDLLQLVLRTVAVKHQYHTEDLYSYLSLDFWLTLHQMTENKSYPPLIEDVVTGFLLNLVEILIAKIRYPPENVYNQWGDKDKEHFLGYRDKFGIFAEKLAIGIQSKKQKFNYMIQILKHQISNNLKAEWQDFENILFIMNAFSEFSYSHKLDCISEIYTLLSHIPCNHLTLTKEILKFIGKNTRSIDDELFDQTVALVLNVFNQKALLASACKSLRNIIEHNFERMSRVSEVVIEAIKQAMERPDIEPAICETLANCLGLLVALQDLNPQVIQVILMPHINVLCNLAAAAQVSNQDQNIGIEKLKIMRRFFAASLRYTRENIPYGFICEFVTHILHYVKEMISPIVQNEVYRWEVFDFLELISIYSVHHFEMMAPKLCEIVQVAYSLKPLPRLLSLAKVLFTISSSEGRQWEALKPMHRLICEKSLQVIGQNPHENCEFIKSFILFMYEFSRETKDFIKFDPNCLLILLRTTMRRLEMEDSLPSKFHEDHTSSLKFLKALIKNNDLIEIVKTEGQRLLEILIVGMAVNLSFDVEDVVGVLVALLDKHRQFVVETLTLILSSDRFHIPLAIQNKMEQFLKVI